MLLLVAQPPLIPFRCALLWTTTFCATMILSSRLPLNDAVEWWASLRLPSSLGAHLPLSGQALLPSDALERTAFTPLGVVADACRRARRPSVPTPLEDDDVNADVLVANHIVVVGAPIGIE